VLPAQAHTEREGTFTSGERRVQRFYPAAHPRGEVRADFQIATELGSLLGLNLKGKFPSLVFAQLCQETPGYQGLTYQKLAEVVEQWPIIGREDLYYGGTSYANKQGLGVQLESLDDEGIQQIPMPELPKGDLVAIPVTKLYDHGTMMLPSKVLHTRLVKPFIALNPADAQAQKATDGMMVNIDVSGDLTPATVIVTEDVPAGFALLPRSCGIPVVKPTAIQIRIAEAVETY
jgi:NADH-quinone oxidoreductase subunit G